MSGQQATNILELHELNQAPDELTRDFWSRMWAKNKAIDYSTDTLKRLSKKLVSDLDNEMGNQVQQDNQKLWHLLLLSTHQNLFPDNIISSLRQCYKEVTIVGHSSLESWGQCYNLIYASLLTLGLCELYLRYQLSGNTYLRILAIACSIPTKHITSLSQVCSAGLLLLERLVIVVENW